MQLEHNFYLDAPLQLLSHMEIDKDGIYGYSFTNSEQSIEIKFREKLAASGHDNLIEAIASHHSVPVMDFEVMRFLRNIPPGGRVIDVGGCWGWHWRKLQQSRPDIQVFIVDFVRANLVHAKVLLGKAINRSIFLIHGDATDLRVPDESFDGYWSAQTLQHVVRLESALNEAQRILKHGGCFANYSLNNSALIRLIFRILKKTYVNEGWMKNSFWLSRASTEQKMMIESIFRTKVTERWSEILYKPELRIFFSGREKSLIGRLDSLLSNSAGCLSFFARQHSFHLTKI